jgi:hypothetical protein
MRSCFFSIVLHLLFCVPKNLSKINIDNQLIPALQGGKMLEAPGGKRNRADRILYLEDLIKQEKERWWEIE